MARKRQRFPAVVCGSQQCIWPRSRTRNGWSLKSSAVKSAPLGYKVRRCSLNRYEKLKQSNVLLIVRWQQCRTRQNDGSSVARTLCALERCGTPFLRGRIAHFCQRLETQQSIDGCVLRTSQAREAVYTKIAHLFFSLFGLTNCRFSHGRVEIKNLRTTNMRCWLENSTKVLWQTWFGTYCTCNKDTINQ